MEYVSIVDQIITAEHNARALAEEGRQQERQVRSGLDQEISALREKYMEQADRRIQQVRQAEQAAAQAQAARLAEKQARALERMRAVYEKNRAQWADTLFGLIVGTGT